MICASVSYPQQQVGGRLCFCGSSRTARVTLMRAQGRRARGAKCTPRVIVDIERQACSAKVQRRARTCVALNMTESLRYDYDNSRRVTAGTLGVD